MDKSRNWTGVAYPESVAEHWLDVLDQTHLDILISPLHDKDKNPDGSLKKPHWHILIIWDGPTTFKNAKKVFDAINAVIEPIAVQSVVGLARYFLHLDNPEKHQYAREDLRVLGALDYDDMIQKTASQIRVLKDMTNFIYDHRIRSFAEFMHYIIENDKSDWFDAASKRNTVYLTSLIKSVWQDENSKLKENEFYESLREKLRNPR